MYLHKQITSLHNLYSVVVIFVSSFYSMKLDVSHLDCCLDVWHVVGCLSVMLWHVTILLNYVRALEFRSDDKSSVKWSWSESQRLHWIQYHGFDPLKPSLSYVINFTSVCFTITILLFCWKWGWKMLMYFQSKEKRWCLSKASVHLQHVIYSFWTGSIEFKEFKFTGIEKWSGVMWWHCRHSIIICSTE